MANRRLRGEGVALLRQLEPKTDRAKETATEAEAEAEKGDMGIESHLSDHGQVGWAHACTKKLEHVGVVQGLQGHHLLPAARGCRVLAPCVIHTPR